MEAKILLIDDETRILQTFARTLRLEGYTVITAEDGEQGLALYHQEQPDIVMLDLRMPGMSGLEVLQAIRERDPEANVILFTAHGDKDAVIEALRAGASDFLSKPVDQVALESALRRAEERARLKRKLRASQEALQRHSERLEEEVKARTAELQDEIEERKQVEVELRFQALLLNQIQDLVTATDLEGNIIYVNEAEVRRLGYDREELMGKPVSVYGQDPSQGATQQEIIETTLESGAWRGEVVNYTADGEEVIVDCRTRLLKDDQGNPVSMVGIATDITERKQAEEALSESHERLLTVLDSIDADIYVADMETYEVLFVNQHMRASFGEGLIGKACWRVFRGESAPCPHCTNDRLLDQDGNPAGVVIWEAKNPITGRWYINYDRAIRWVDGRLVRLQVATDVSARKRVKEALEESEERYRNIVELAPDGILTLNLNGVVTSCNSAFLKLTGYSKDEIVGTHVSKFPTLRVEDIPEYTRLVLLALRGRPIEPLEFVWVHKDGTTRWGEAHVAQMKRGSSTYGLQLMLRDITSRKRTERLLEALNRAALATKEAFTPDEVFARVSEELEEMGISCALYLTDQDRANLFPKFLTYDSAAIRAVERLVGVKREDFSIPVDRADAYREVVREKRTVFVENTDELVRQLLPRPIKRFAPQIVKIVGIRKAIDAPLIVEGEVIGILAVQSDELTAADIPTITAFAHEVAAAWHKAQLLEEAHELTTKLKAIARPARQMSALLDRDELALQVVASLQEITGCYNANLFLQEGDDLVFAAGRGGYEDGSPPVGYRLSPGEGIIGHVAKTGQPVLTPDVEQDPRYVAWKGLPHTRSELAVPLKRGDRVLGVMDMQSVEPDAFDATDLEALGVLADQLAVAVENARLYQKVRRQADELQAAVDRLEELDRLKSEFIQNVSHELRSPLALIRGYAEMLDMGELGSLDPAQEKPVTIIARRARMLSALVEDITLILGTETSPPDPEPVSLDGLARAAVADFQISAATAELTLETDIASDLPPVRGTPTHLRRVLDNLIENAIKFTPPNGTISVHLRELDEDRVLLEVSDTGIGIPPDQRDRIFERFYQVNGSTKRRYPGTGLGLALVKEIIETYGGEVSVKSEVGAGSTLAIALPVFGKDRLQQKETRGT